jgi:hypothetical protein
VKYLLGDKEKIKAWWIVHGKGKREQVIGSEQWVHGGGGGIVGQGGACGGTVVSGELKGRGGREGGGV